MADKYQKMKRKKTVLVISDRQEQFAQTAFLLRRDGHLVQFLKNLTTTDEIKAEPPSLIICELAAPDIDGPTICRNVRDEMGKIPVLMVGDLPNRSAIVTGSLKCGATTYLQKPIASMELTDLCREMLESEENVSSYDARDVSFGSFQDLGLVVTDDTRNIEGPENIPNPLTRKFAEPEFESRAVIRWVSNFNIRKDLISTS